MWANGNEEMFFHALDEDGYGSGVKTYTVMEV